jgi:transposase
MDDPPDTQMIDSTHVKAHRLAAGRKGASRSRLLAARAEGATRRFTHSQMPKGRLLAFLLTGGEAHDCPVAERLIRRVPSKRMLGDKAHDSADLREELERGTKPVIPNRCNRKQPFSFSKRLYKLRWRIENTFNRLRDFRRIATRYDRLAQNYRASVCLAAALVWWI